MENTKNGRHNDTDGNLNTSNSTSSRGSDISNSHTLKKKGHNTKKYNNSESHNLNLGGYVRKNTHEYSDSEEEEINVSPLAQTGEYPDPESSFSSGLARNKVRNVIFDSDSEPEEVSLGSLFQKDDISGTKRSETHGSSNRIIKNKLRSIVSDSDSENEAIVARAQKTSDSSKVSNSMDINKRPLDEEISSNTDVQKRRRLTLIDDRQD